MAINGIFGASCQRLDNMLNEKEAYKIIEQYGTQTQLRIFIEDMKKYKKEGYYKKNYYLSIK